MTSPEPFVMDLDGGGTARLVRADGERATFEASRPFPPGAPMTGRGRDGSGEYRMKVRGSRRLSAPEGVFHVEGRFVNLTRAQREHLSTRVGSADSSSGE